MPSVKTLISIIAITDMKTKYYITLLIAAMGSSLSFGGPISGLDSVYTKGTTTYNGQNADTLNVSTPTTLSLAGSGTWTMAFTISNLQETTENQVGLLFTYNTNHPYPVSYTHLTLPTIA